MVAVSLNRFVVARMILIRNRWKERSKKTKGQRETERVTFAVALTFGFRKKTDKHISWYVCRNIQSNVTNDSMKMEKVTERNEMKKE